MRILSAVALVAALGLSACQTGDGNPLSAETVAKPVSQAKSTDMVEQSTKAETPSKNVDTLKTAAIGGKVITSYSPPAKGTVFTWRNNWEQLPTIISYRVAGTLKKGNTEYLKLTSVKGFKNTIHAYYDTRNFALKGYRDASDKALVTYKPMEQRYRFPMKPGDQWVTSWNSIQHDTKAVSKGGGVVKVEAFETIKTPAGSFETLRVRMPIQSGAPKGMTHHIWFAPKLGITVKEKIGGGMLNWTQILDRVDAPSN